MEVTIKSLALKKPHQNRELASMNLSAYAWSHMQLCSQFKPMQEGKYLQCCERISFIVELTAKQLISQLWGFLALRATVNT